MGSVQEVLICSVKAETSEFRPAVQRFGVQNSTILICAICFIAYGTICILEFFPGPRRRPA